MKKFFRIDFLFGAKRLFKDLKSQALVATDEHKCKKKIFRMLYARSNFEKKHFLITDRKFFCQINSGVWVKPVRYRISIAELLT